MQGGWFSGSRIGTLVCVPLTSDLRWAEVPGNVVLPGTDVVLGWRVRARAGIGAGRYGERGGCGRRWRA